MNETRKLAALVAATGCDWSTVADVCGVPREQATSWASRAMHEQHELPLSEYAQAFPPAARAHVGAMAAFAKRRIEAIAVALADVTQVPALCERCHVFVDDSGCCPKCSAGMDDPCPVCDGVAYHGEGCSEADR